MYDLEPRKTFKFAIDSLLGKGEVNQTGGEQIEVSFDFSDYTQKTFEISADDITFINKPAGKDVQIDNEKIVGVTIFGPSSSIEKLKASDLKATVDLSDVTSNGSISHEVVIYSESYSDVWNIGTHEAVINVSEQTSTSSSDT
jgi:YbbR domain-containing protein